MIVEIDRNKNSASPCLKKSIMCTMKITKSVKIHTSSICAIDTLSTNADLIVFGCENGDICLGNTNKNTIVWKNVDSVEKEITSIQVSPNDEIVAVGSWNQFLLVIDVNSGKTICSVDVGSRIHRVLFLFNRKIACGLRNGTVNIIDWQLQKIEKNMKLGKIVFALAVSPIDNDILLTSDGFGTIKQTLISSEKLTMTYKGDGQYAVSLSFLPCGNEFVSGGYSGTCRLYSLGREQAIRVFQGKIWEIRSASLIQDDEFLVTASYSEIVNVWNIASGECVSTIKTHQRVWCGAVSKDKKSLIVGGYGGKVTIFSCPAPPCVSLDRSLRLE